MTSPFWLGQRLFKLTPQPNGSQLLEPLDGQGVTEEEWEHYCRTCVENASERHRERKARDRMRFNQMRGAI